MHKKTLRIKRQIDRILVGLPGTERGTVVRELTEIMTGLLVMYSKPSKPSAQPYPQPYPANLKVPPEAIRLLLKDKSDLAALVKDDQSNHICLTYCRDVDQIGQGLKRVEFDFENYYYENDPGYRPAGHLLGPRYFGKIPGVGCYAGGDWEHPLFFIVYLDEDGQTLRAYIPKEGNIWNHKTNSAFGNDSESDASFLKGWLKTHRPDITQEEIGSWGDDTDDTTENARVMFNEADLIKDIEENLTVLEAR